MVPKEIRRLYAIHEWRNAMAILTAAHSGEWSDIVKVLGSFKLMRTDVLAPGGRKSLIANKLDGHFYRLGWKEKGFETSIVVDETVYEGNYVAKSAKPVDI